MTWTDLSSFGFFFSGCVPSSFSLLCPLSSFLQATRGLLDFTTPGASLSLQVSSPHSCSGSRWPATPPSSCCLGTQRCTGLSPLSLPELRALPGAGGSLGPSREGFGSSEAGLGPEKGAPRQTSRWVLSQDPHYQGFFRGHTSRGSCKSPGCQGS